jgi:hypothetical protein
MRIVLALATAASLLATAQASQAASLAFTTIDNPGDPTFNQLLGITNTGEISGYFGSGATGHPNQAYLIAPPYTSYQPANVPGSVQTQADAINGSTVAGFWSGTNNGIGQDANYGFVRTTKSGKTQYFLVNDAAGSIPATAQVLGVNGSQIAAGFYVDANGNSHGFAYSVATSTYTPVTVPGAVQVSATGINNSNLICGFYVDSANIQHAFLKALTGGTAIHFTVPGAAVTQFLGVNSKGVAVGFYQLTSNDITHGIIYNPANGQWQQLDDPNGVGGTVLNGLNDKGEIVGFYTDAATNVHGMLITGAP